MGIDGDDDSATWRPWRALAERPEIEFTLADLPPGLNALWCRDPATGNRAIVISKRLSPIERMAALTHELVHDERRGAGHHTEMPDAWAPVVSREEERTDDIAARRLMPARKLEAWVAAEVDLGHQVTAERCADRFDVTIDIARRSLRHLQADHARITHGLASAG